MSGPWYPRLADQREQAITALADRCSACGQRRPQAPIEIETAIKAAVDEFGIERAELLGRSHAPLPTAARSFAVWALRSLGEPHSYPAIGRALCRSHSTAIHLHQKAVLLRLRSAEFASACDRVTARVLATTETADASH